MENKLGCDCSCHDQHDEPCCEAVPADREISTLRKVARVFIIVCCVLQCFYLIPMAWCIPMTVSLNRRIVNKEPISIGFKICTLIFLSLVGGILLLCDSSDENL